MYGDFIGFKNYLKKEKGELYVISKYDYNISFYSLLFCMLYSLPQPPVTVHKNIY